MSEERQKTWDKAIGILTTEAGTGIYAYSNGNCVMFELDLINDENEKLIQKIEKSNKEWETVDMYLRLQATNFTLVLMNKSNDPNITKRFTNRVEYRGKWTSNIAKFVKSKICSKIQHCRRGNNEGRQEIIDAILSGKAREDCYPFDDNYSRLDDAIRDSDFNSK